MSTNNNYGIDNIDTLDGAERIRRRPASMLGSDGLDGAKHTFLEIIGNSTDECTGGHCGRLDVRLHEDGSISVRDYGRGVPLEWSERKQRFGWDMIYNELYGGGKLESTQNVLKSITDWSTFKVEDFNYLFSIGLNGVGAACTQYTSEFFRVHSYRDGFEREMYFEGGYPVYDELLESPQGDQPNGTLVHWKPDTAVFKDVNIPFSWIKSIVEPIAHVTGVEVNLYNGSRHYHYPAGNIKDYLQEQLQSPVSYEKLLFNSTEEGKIVVCEAQVVLGKGGFGSSFYNNQIRVYGGVHETYLNGAVVEFLKGLAKEQDVKLEYSDVIGGFSAIVSTLANEKSYRGQTKDSMDNVYIGQAIYKAVTRVLSTSWFRRDEWLVKLLRDAIQKAQIRIAQKALETEIKEVSKAINKNVMPESLVSCEDLVNKKYGNVELFLVEGKSALGPAKAGRNSKFQAILPFRGKGLNVEKALVSDAVKNKEIEALLSVIGAGITVPEAGYEMFDISKSKVNKIILLADADHDGAHIRLLHLVVINKFLRPFLEAGRVYIANAPKYKAGNTFYTTDKEFEEAKANGLVGSSFKRFKGLGQMEAKDLALSCMDPATRNLTQVKIDPDDYELQSVISMLAGRDTNVRKREIISLLMDGYDSYEDALSSLRSVYDSMEVEEVLEHEEIFY